MLERKYLQVASSQNWDETMRVNNTVNVNVCVCV